MTVSDRMMDMMEDQMDFSAAMTDDGVLRISVNNTEAAAQAVINAAWTKYNPDDESTWPDVDGKLYFTVDEDGEEYHVVWRRNHNTRWIGMTHYADPQHLTPTGDGDD